MASPSLLWGLGLGVLDGALYTLIRDSFKIWTKYQKPNGPVNSMTKLWQNLIIACVLGGFIFPYMYFWAAYSVGSIAEIHIYRCIISLLLSLFIGTMIYKDTINGFRSLGLAFTIIGMCLILISTAYGSESNLSLTP
jgi:hypothetical protein